MADCHVSDKRAFCCRVTLESGKEEMNGSACVCVCVWGVYVGVCVCSFQHEQSVCLYVRIDGVLQKFGHI